MKKLNCWEFKRCGRQPGGDQTHDLGVCPVTSEKKLNGVHGGSNAGRACWIIHGTLCDGKVQGTFVEKYHNCIECDFYKQVKTEESTAFNLSAGLYMKLH